MQQKVKLFRYFTSDKERQHNGFGLEVFKRTFKLIVLIKREPRIEKWEKRHIEISKMWRLKYAKS